MSQATFDPTTPGGPTDDTSATGTSGANETRESRGQGARRRPSRRGHAASAKAAAAEATTTQPATTPEPTATPAAATVVAPVESTPAADETGARAEGRGRRTRGGAKRPARGAKGAQLIITKTNEEAQPETAELARATEQPAASAAADPVIVPVVSAGSSAAAEAPATPRKTRFGLPRRLQQPIITPTVAPASRAADISGVAAETPSAESAAAESAQPEAAPAEPAAAATIEAPAPRYRFDRSRRTTIPGVPPTRPERLSSQPTNSLYTQPETETAEPAQPATTREATRELFELPPLESLVSREAGSELPALTFEEPAPSAAEEAEHLGEGAEGGEGTEEGAGGASRRRRRRRRNTPAHNGAHGVEVEEGAEGAEEGAPPSAHEEAIEEIYGEEPPVETAEPLYPEQGARPSYSEPVPQRGRGGRLGYPSRTSRRAPVEPSWDTTTAQPPAAEVSPYSGPEPSYARGFGPTPSGVAMPVRETYPRPSRIDRNADPMAAAVTQLGAVMREAINTQTDRLLTELRHQQPPAVTLTIPNAMTAERVGIFVDVANVVYSLRGLRTSIDFGRLLDFLRANRRLARAQAYAPTNPEPGADQAFLNAVKGMGYRITTKNYKTFSNGAKKADLDLDLCMDIVRLVEAKAVDTIVLVSGDSDFLPLLDFCYDHGVRVEVAAFDDAASMILRQSCDLFVNLSLVESIRG